MEPLRANELFSNLQGDEEAERLISNYQALSPAEAQSNTGVALLEEIENRAAFLGLCCYLAPLAPETVASGALAEERTATKVVSSAQKFVIPVSTQCDEPLVYPPGHEKAGTPILDWKGNPIGERGIVFHNPKDNSIESAPGDGTGVVIINEVSREHAAALYAMIDELGGDPRNLSLQELRELLQFARSLGLKDMYHSDVTFISQNMQPVEAVGSPTKDTSSGFM